MQKPEITGYRSDSETKDPTFSRHHVYQDYCTNQSRLHWGSTTYPLPFLHGVGLLEPLISARTQLKS